MRINWCFASTLNFDATVDIEKYKSIGPSWGSWKTWRGCGTDNVICNDMQKSKELINRAFQAVCNFYVPKKFYTDLNRPVGVKLYDGDFNKECDEIEDIIAMHLAGSQSDIVLLVGYNFNIPDNFDDKLARHKMTNYHGLIRSIINSNQTVQWVLVDYSGELNKAYQNLTNLTCDSMDNVLKLLS